MEIYSSSFLCSTPWKETGIRMEAVLTSASDSFKFIQSWAW